MAGKRLTRDLDEAMLGGVIAGMAHYWDLDVTLVRLLALILIIPTGGIVVPAYFAAWLIIPRPDHLEAAQAGVSQGLRTRLRPDEISAAAREAGDAARRAADRVVEAARLATEGVHRAADAARAAADAARTAAEEFADIAHHSPRHNRHAGGHETASSGRTQPPAEREEPVPPRDSSPL